MILDYFKEYYWSAFCSKFLYFYGILFSMAGKFIYKKGWILPALLKITWAKYRKKFYLDYISPLLINAKTPWALMQFEIFREHWLVRAAYLIKTYRTLFSKHLRMGLKNKIVLALFNQYHKEKRRYRIFPECK